MKTVFVFFLSLVTVLATAQKDKNYYLAKITKYNEASSFEDIKYKDLTWQQFYMMEESNELVDPANYDFDLMNAACFFAINKYRAANGVPPVKFEPRLRDAASIHSDQMVRRNFFDHINPYEAAIQYPNNRTEMNGYNGERIAENLARIYIPIDQPMNYLQVADKAVKELSHSKEHNKHMLDRDLNQLGCALLFEPRPTDGYYYFRLTQEFGKSW